MKISVVKLAALVVVIGVIIGMGAVATGGLAYGAARLVGAASQVVAAQGPDPDGGIVIAQVAAGGPAAQAGVVRGDILLTLDGVSVDDTHALVDVLGVHEPGDELTLTVLHGDEQRTLTATLGDQNGRSYLGLSPCGGLPQARRMVWSLVGPGAVVTEVMSDSPAAEAGLQAGDRIISVEGQEVNAEATLADLIAGYSPGDTVTLQVARSGEAARDVAVKLGEHPDDADKAYLGVRYLSMPFRAMPESFGHFPRVPFLAEPTQPGVIIQRVAEGSPAEAAGLQAGDVITAVDGAPLNSPGALVNAIAERRPGDTIALTVAASEGAAEREVQVTLAANPEDEEAGYLGVVMGGFMWRSERARPPAEKAPDDSSDQSLRLRLPFTNEPLELDLGKIRSRFEPYLLLWRPDAHSPSSAGPSA